MIGLSALSALFGGGLASIGAAMIAALMAEYFGRKKRSHLPTLLTALAFLAFTLKGADTLLGGSPIMASIIASSL